MSTEEKSWQRKQAEAEGYKTFYAKVWAYDEDGEEDEFTEFDITLEQIEALDDTTLPEWMKDLD